MISTIVSVTCFLYLYKAIYQCLLNKLLPEDAADLKVRELQAK